MVDKFRVVVADDHPVILFGAAHALSSHTNFEIVGQARHSSELIPLLEKGNCDVLVTDLAMPGGKYGDGLPLLDYLRRHFPTVRVVVLTSLENPALLKRLYELGVEAIVSKADPLSHIASAVASAANGQHYVSPSVKHVLADTGLSENQMALDTRLSKRELEVIRHFVSGRTIKEIGAFLNRSVKTVSTQKTMAMRKLGIQRDSQLFQYAQSHGLLNFASGDLPDAQVDDAPLPEAESDPDQPH